MKQLIMNASVLNEQGEAELKSILIADGKILAIANADAGVSLLVEEGASGQELEVEKIDAQGKLVIPGLIDMHVHLREPGFEYKETIETGSRAAVKGGFTTIACMPNTRPVTDNVDTVQLVLKKGQEAGLAKVLPYAAITKNELGRELTDFEALKAAGAIGFTDDGVGVQSAQMMKDAMSRAKALDMPVIAHCEDNTLVVGAAVTDGEFAKRHGLKGIPNESEAIHVGRDILLSEATGAHYHVCHVSTEQSVRLIRHAKSFGIKVTAEVCPHHLVLSDEDIPGLDANWKMNPPLRSPRDVQACIEGLEDGTIDIIVTDHAAHSEEEKARGLELAPFGIVGFETAFPLLYTKFVATGKWTLDFLVRRMTTDPARVFRLDTGRLEEGAPADLTMIDLEQEQAVDPQTFASKGRNTPFTGWKLKGWPVKTWVDGKLVWSADEAK
ncbi:dihydroorotase [Paenibacillus polymyxa]|jgi:dihydroorotase|uniref:dihydroorotase n=1 Tax=Paenibacillus polymyxa TaxID=1406 RepID=UPI001580BE9A|nr:dihydroorotase [Paenibacillus polymyxa]MBY0022515.1 dihydroorotase [Paenibacillus polymyxa]MBY0056722.1 dihydroorotase [Paenibacillus polymyxa]MBY0070030.1 dihydroorotase [Paenibacillus polymyxa]MBY0079987.1 dihydroorotase [Paenibacillus polymyxa]MBZ6444062.1 dihydroorotase [Paenibacillus polymyxa]